MKGGTFVIRPLLLSNFIFYNWPKCRLIAGHDIKPLRGGFGAKLSFLRDEFTERKHDTRV